MNQPTPASEQRRPNRAFLHGTIFLFLAILANVIPALYALNDSLEKILLWVTLLLPAIGVLFFLVGLKRAFGQSNVYRGKILGSILTVVSVFLLAASVFFHIHAKELPGSAGAPKVGQKAPDFTLNDVSGAPQSLAQLLSSPIDASVGKAPKAVLLVFYRGYW